MKDPELPGTDLEVDVDGSTITFENPDDDADGQWIEYDGLMHTLNGNTQ